MNPQQQQAFEAAAGPGMTAGVLNMLCIGGLLAVLFLWAAWGLLDVYQGWANEKVRAANMARFAIRTVLLLLICLWMFAS
ncbi:TIGR03758 family integrating conjugative element protein [Providencia hangzhouensis]|uniref:Integrating conjugative element protein, PFL_4701 family n=1 Tax=Providencia rettgeri TaxID=587 RepID=A0A9N8CYC8_PRORE|nr:MULTISPECIES: TIGR03758 family integrating conjugative element protein [Providencia]MCB4855644.1 TIGR03758 family integrating conjugative element protein [Providencia rettgeri]MCW4539365.1 TIGR03758 family integrating conjugative element protein [Providencia rettgeri]MDX4117355.1 TIGR03758 family integrating conjugative element protein [Providencia rettgeri]UPQ40173.1 TIGR03758 family integrating conjugative element protein [Providencia rettgeri]CAB5649834.1 integrating conjugative element 